MNSLTTFAITLTFLFISATGGAQTEIKDSTQVEPVVSPGYEKANVDFDYFEKVTAEAKAHRKSRLIDFETFVSYSKDENTIILDTRSKRMYDKMHIKGAIHINFADFTQEYLAEMIPDNNTRILIYCNNNFYQEPVLKIPFPTKAYTPPVPESNPFPAKTLALNIPTYINLYGYNYKNVYELSELVSSKHEKLEMEGTDAPKFNKVKRSGK